MPDAAPDAWRSGRSSRRTGSDRRSRPPSPRPASHTPAAAADAITTSLLGRPTAAVKKRSIAAASEYGSLPLIDARVHAAHRRHVSDPDQLRAADGLRAGRRQLLERRRGRGRHRVSCPTAASGHGPGGAIRTEAAIAACQSEVGASATAPGWVPGAADGYTASATPAASATGSAPGTRVVFLVAVTGKPSCFTAFGDAEATPTVTVVDCVLIRSLVLPQPHRSRPAVSEINGSHRRIGADVSGRPAVERRSRRSRAASGNGVPPGPTGAPSVRFEPTPHRLARYAVRCLSSHRPRRMRCRAFPGACPL